MIDIIVPCLGRPHNAQPLVDSLAASGADARIVFVCTGGDKRQIEACQATGATTLVVTWKAGPGDYAKKINYGYLNTDSPCILNGSDDIEFTPGWDTQALRKMKGRIGVVATNDKANRQVMRGEFGTHCLISRAYIDDQGGTGDKQQGVILYEGYDHNFVDRELCEVAKRRRAYQFAPLAIVRHRHPLWQTAKWDSTYRKALARFQDDQRLYASRTHLWAARNRDIVAR